MPTLTMCYARTNGVFIVVKEEREKFEEIKEKIRQQSCLDIVGHDVEFGEWDIFDKETKLKTMFSIDFSAKLQTNDGHPKLVFVMNKATWLSPPVHTFTETMLVL
jgi:hypothetical protein